MLLYNGNTREPRQGQKSALRGDTPEVPAATPGAETSARAETTLSDAKAIPEIHARFRNGGKVSKDMLLREGNPREVKIKYTIRGTYLSEAQTIPLLYTNPLEFFQTQTTAPTPPTYFGNKQPAPDRQIKCRIKWH